MDGNGRGTLYVSDLDGTLLNRDARLSPYTADVLNRLIGEGMRFCYATARSLSSASRITREIRAHAPAIVYNGAFTRWADTGEVIDSAYFGAEHKMEILRHLLAASIYPIVYAHIDGVERVSYVAGRETDGVAHYIAARPGDARFRAVRDERALCDGDAFYFTCIGKQRDLLPALEHFRDDPECNCFLQRELYRPQDHWFELMPRRASKGNAILRLKRMMGCERVVAFGDGVNDLAMFAIADECYAVENAVDELKRAATGIIAANEDDGVAKFLLARMNG